MHTRRCSIRTLSRGRGYRGPAIQRVCITIEKDESSKCGEAGDILVKCGPERLPEVAVSQVCSPAVLYAQGSILSALVIVALDPAQLCSGEDVVVGGGGMVSSEIDLSSPLIGSVSKERNIHGVAMGRADVEVKRAR